MISAVLSSISDFEYIFVGQTILFEIPNEIVWGLIWNMNIIILLNQKWYVIH